MNSHNIAALVLSYRILLVQSVKIQRRVEAEISLSLNRKAQEKPVLKRTVQVMRRNIFSSFDVMM